MSELQDEPIEKVLDDKDLAEDMLAYELNEEVWGTLKCYNCGYRGRMEGVIPHQDKRNIVFVCPECSTIERVKNPDFEQ